MINLFCMTSPGCHGCEFWSFGASLSCAQVDDLVLMAGRWIDLPEGLLNARIFHIFVVDFAMPGTEPAQCLCAVCSGLIGSHSQHCSSLQRAGFQRLQISRIPRRATSVLLGLRPWNSNLVSSASVGRCLRRGYGTRLVLDYNQSCNSV